jgi:hypothetical protein
MNLAVRALMQQIEDAAKSQGFHEARVQFKTNASGELVVACIIPPRTPHEWGPPATREQRKASRESR